MDVAVGHARELGDEAPHEGAAGIELLALDHGVEDPEVRRGVGARRCRPLPASIVRRGITVHEPSEEEGLTEAPVEKKIFRKKARDDHAQPVVHPARLRELTHPRVDEWIAGTSLAPGRKRFGIVVPDDGIVRGPMGAMQDARVLGEDRVVEVAPDELVDPFARALAAARVGSHPMFGGGDAGADADRAEAEVRREPRRPVAGRDVARVRVVGEGVVQECGESRARGGLTARR